MSENMLSDMNTWYGETRLERLDRCRRFLFGEQIISVDQNDKIRGSLEAARDRALIAEQDAMAPSVFAPDEDPAEDDREADDG